MANIHICLSRFTLLRLMRSPSTLNLPEGRVSVGLALASFGPVLILF